MSRIYTATQKASARGLPVKLVVELRWVVRGAPSLSSSGSGMLSSSRSRMPVPHRRSLRTKKTAPMLTPAAIPTITNAA